MNLYTVLDFETTGLNQPTGVDQPTQVAAIKYDETGKEVARLSTYVRLKPDKKPSSTTPDITIGLCNTGLSYGTIQELLFEFIEESTLVCQSAPFDMSFLDWHPVNFICTRALTWLVEPDENPSLAPTCERHGIKLENHHDAIADVVAAKEVLFLMMKKAKEKNIEFHNTVVNFKNRPLTFFPVHATIIEE